jgi:hypothetical protein
LLMQTAGLSENPYMSPAKAPPPGRIALHTQRAHTVTDHERLRSQNTIHCTPPHGICAECAGLGDLRGPAAKYAPRSLPCGRCVSADLLPCTCRRDERSAHDAARDADRPAFAPRRAQQPRLGRDVDHDERQWVRRAHAGALPRAGTSAARAVAMLSLCARPALTSLHTPTAAIRQHGAVV